MAENVTVRRFRCFWADFVELTAAITARERDPSVLWSLGSHGIPQLTTYGVRITVRTQM